MARAVQLPTALHMHNSLLINETIMGIHSLISSSATPCCCVCLTILELIMVTMNIIVLVCMRGKSVL